jgi:alkanesulfonate monooxygenase SsuD/methylene tetrahydromethanopterin reductase-like flavin-dependent oxidoreductase (luciferase family)
MRRGITVPIFGELADPGVLATLGIEAEQAGLDGFFVWDHLHYRPPVQAVTDPWISLAAIADRTSRIALGPMVTPLARRRPAVLARQVAALDRLSGGRVVLGTGLGLDSSGGEFAPFGEEPDIRVRASRYDEALVLLRDLLSGEPVTAQGQHFQVPDGVRFLPTPAQSRLPIWVACRWPNRKPLERAIGQDGVFVIDIEPGDLPKVIAFVRERRPSGLTGFDVVVDTAASQPAEPWADAGATWCLATFDPFTVTARDVRHAIERWGTASS